MNNIFNKLPTWFNKWLLPLSLIVVVMIATGLGLFWGLPAAQAQSGGVTPTQISTAAELRAIADDLSGNYVLANDISLLNEAGDTVDWTPIGDGGNPFTGVFDGASYEISGLWLNTETTQCEFGLFGTVKGGTVRNVGLRDVYISSEGTNCASAFNRVGGLVGILDGNGRVEASYVLGGSVRGHLFTGGLVGVSGDDSTITGSFTDAQVVGLRDDALGVVGGLVGQLGSNSEVRSSYSLSDVSGQGSNLGGLVGALIGGPAVISSFASGNVTGDGGSLAGNVVGTSKVIQSYQTIRSAETATYISPSNLKGATAATSGFDTWDDDLCPNGTPNVDAPVWSFGGTDELPIINCISSHLQRGFTRISTAAELQAIGDDLEKNYFLANDISLLNEAGDTVDWTPIGNVVAPFKGVFDGKGYEISGLLSTTGTAWCEFGLFGYVTGGTVRNVGLRDVYISSEGTGCGRNFNSVGGLVGFLDSTVLDGTGRVEASYVLDGSVRGHLYTGGLVGAVGNGSTITGSFTDVQVVGLRENAIGGVGGLVGLVGTKSSVRSSYALGNVSGMASNLGGLVGVVNGSDVISSFATGNVAGGGGGLVGNVGGTATVSQSYQTTDSSATATYKTLYELRVADTTTVGFETWGNDICANEAVTGAGEAVWNFGGRDDLPIINCISSDLQRSFTQISTAAELQAIATGDLRGNYVLTNDISLRDLDTGDNRVNWTPIGHVDDPFTGVFDGAGYEIRDLYLASGDFDLACLAGLFGHISGGTVRNLGLRDVVLSNKHSGCDNSSVVNNSSVGGLVARLTDGARVEASYVVGGSVSGYNRVGGLVGSATGASTVILGSFADVEVIGVPRNNGNFVSGRGGLVGRLRDGVQVRSSYALGTISGPGYRRGGLVGDGGASGEVGGIIISSFASVSGNFGDNGGLVGITGGSMITESYQTTRSAQAETYRSADDLAAATAATSGFETWDDDLCGTDAAFGAGEAAWNFRVAGLPPIVNCISAEVQREGASTVIRTVADLRAVGNNLNGDYVLGNDISLLDGVGMKTPWTPIGIPGVAPFTGTFDGAGYEISGLGLNGADAVYCSSGLFGAVSGPGAVVLNVGLRDVDTFNPSPADPCYQDVSSFSGALAGVVGNGARVEASYVVGGSVSNYGIVGGLVGMVTGMAIISNSFADVQVFGLPGASENNGRGRGGLVGMLDDRAEIRSSYARGNVGGEGSGFGGLVGRALVTNPSGRVDDSFATGSGGLVGEDAIATVLFNSYQTTDPSDSDTYISEADLHLARLTTPGFETWGMAECSDATAHNAGGAAWNFGLSSELPFLNCISGQVQGVPTRIRTPADLRAIGDTPESLSGSYVLKNDIDLAEFANWDSIGSVNHAFRGVLDGNGYEIQNLRQVAGGTCAAGLFENIAGSHTVVRNLGLRDVDISVPIGCGEPVTAAGALTAFLVNGARVEASYVIGGSVTGDLTGVNSSVGGLVGTLLGSSTSPEDTEIVASFADVRVGGLAGVNANMGESRGGLVGRLSVNSVLRSSYSLSDVGVSNGNVGGLVGVAGGSVAASVQGVFSSFAAGDLQRGDDVLIDGNDSDIILGRQNYQTIYESDVATYVSLADLRAATVDTPDFDSWDDDLCPAGTPNAGQPVWNFGGSADLPSIRCIALSQAQVGVQVTSSEASTVLFEGSSFDLSFVLDSTPSESVTVRITPDASNTAALGEDYTISDTEIVLADAGTPVVVTATLSEDNLMEADEILVLNYEFVGDAGNVLLSPRGSREITVRDSLRVVQVTSSTTRQPLLLEGQSFDLFFELNLTPIEAVTVRITPGVGGTAALGEDYTISDTEIVLTDAGIPAVVTVTLLDDNKDEPNEFFLLNYELVGSPAGVILSDTIIDIFVFDINVPVFAFSLTGPLAVHEDGEAISLTVNSDIPVLNSVDLVIRVAGDTDDLGVVPVGGDTTVNVQPSGFSFSRTIEAGEITSDPISIRPVNDAEQDTGKSVTISSNQVGGSSAGLVLNLIDDDVPTVTFSVAAGGDTFGEGAGVVDLSVVAGFSPTTADVNVNFIPSGLTAGLDYTLSPESVTFAAGTTALSETVTLILLDDEVEDMETRTLSIAYSLMLGDGETVVFSPLDLTITDDDAPVVSVASSVASVDEGGDVVLTFTADRTPLNDLVVSIGGDSGADLALSAETVTLRAGRLSETVTLTAIVDGVGEAVETVALTFSLDAGASSRATLAPDSRGLTLTVTDTPVVSVAVADGGDTFIESAGVIILEVVADTAPVGGDLTVSLLTSGLMEGVDYTLSPETVTFAAGASGAGLSETVTVTLIDDAVEDTETRSLLITPVISPTTRGLVGSPLELMIIDDDAPLVSVRHSADSVGEGGEVTLTFTADRTPINDLVVSIAGGNNADLTLSADSVTLRAGRLSETVTLTAIADGIDELDENTVLTFDLDTGASSRATLASDSRGLTLTILDVPFVSVSLVSDGGDTFGEGAGAVELRLVADAAPMGEDLAVTLEVGGGLTAGVDYTLSPESVTFAAGTAALSETVTLTLIDDELEDTETRSLSIAPVISAGMRGMAGSPLVLTIVDDDLPIVSVMSNLNLVGEGGVAILTIASDKTPLNDLVVSITGGNDADSTLSANTVTLRAGRLSEMVTLTAISDGIDEGDESVVLTFDLDRGASSQAKLASGSSRLTLGITDAPAVNITKEDGRSDYDENAGAITLNVVADTAPIAGDLTVDLMVSGLVEGVDYTLSPESVTFAAGASGAGLRETVTLTLIDDDVEDEAERILSITSVITPVGRAVVGAPLELTITDDDAPVVTVTSDAATVREGETIALVFTASKTPLNDLVVNVVNIAGGGNGADAVLSANSVILRADRLSDTIAFMAIADGVDEPDEDVVLTFDLNRGSSRAILATSSRSLTVTVTDSPSVSVSVAEGGNTVGEDAGMITLEVVADIAPLGGDLTVGLAASGLVAGVEYTLSPETVTFAAGASGAGLSETVTLTLIDNDVEDEAVRGLLITPVVTPATRGAAGSSLMLNIEDDDTPEITVERSVAATVNEGETISLTFTASNVPLNDLVVSIVGGNDVDSTLSASSVTLRAGQLSVAVTFMAVADGVDEPDEDVVLTFNLNTGLSSQARLSPGDDSLAITILDAPSVSVVVVEGEDTVGEDAGTITLNVVADTAPFGGDLAVTLVTSGLVEGVDYTLSPETVTFAAGASGAALSETVTLTLIDNDVEDEAVRILSIMPVVGPAILGASSSPLELTITDDDTPQITVEVIGSTRVNEGDDVMVTVRASKTPINPLTVSLTDGTDTGGLGALATAGDDYTVGVRTFTLESGTLEVTGTVSVLTDNVDELVEVVSLVFELSDAGNSRATLAPVTVRLLVDDTTEPELDYVPSPLTYIEGETTTFVIESDIVLAAAVTFAVELVGGGTSAHFDFTPSVVTIAAGERVSDPITLLPKDDDEVEPAATERLRAVIGSADGFDVSALTPGLVVNVIDDDSPNVMVLASGGMNQFDEDVSTIELSVSLTASPNSEVVLDLVADGGTLSADEYVFPAITRFTFDAGETTLTQTAILRINDDDFEEDDETLRIAYEVLPSSTGAMAVGSPLILTITDDDAPVVSIMSSSDSVEEGDEVTLTFRTDKVPRNDLVVSIMGVNGGDATLSDETVTLTLDRLEQQVTFGADRDTANEPDELISLTFNLDAGVSSQATLAPGANSLGITILDAPHVTVEVAGGGTGFDEDDGVVTLNVMADRAPFGGDLDVTLTGSGLTEGLNGDYTLTPPTVTFAAGTTDLSRPVSLTLINDELEETEERMLSIALMAAPPTRGTAMSTPLELTIRDDDAPRITVTSSSATLKEGEAVTVTLTSDKTPAGALTVNIMNAGGNGVLSHSSVTFGAGAMGADLTQTVMFSAHTDSVNEETQNVLLTFALGAGASPRANLVTTDLNLMIEDAPHVTVEVAGGGAGFAENVGDITLNVVADTAPFGGDLEVTLTASSLGLARTEYSLSPPTVTFAAGTPDLSRPVTLTLINDELEETEERTLSITPMIASGSEMRGTAGLPLSLTVTDDDTPEITVERSAASVSEGGEVTLTFTTSKTPRNDLMVGITDDGGADTTLSVGSVTFTPSDTGDDLVQTVVLGAVADTDNEENEDVALTFTLTAGASRASLITTGFNIMILDAPHVMVELAGGGTTMLDEDAGDITVNVVLDRAPVGDDLTVNLAASSPDLVEGADYEFSPKAVNFPAGTTDLTQPVTLTLTGDEVEEEEMRSLTITPALAPANGGSVGAPLSLTVTDDDTPLITVEVSGGVSSFRANEGDVVSLTVRTNKVPRVSLTLSLMPGTDTGDYNRLATPGEDYSVGTGDITLSRDTLEVMHPVNILADNTDELVEVVSLVISLPSGSGSRATVESGTVILRVDDGDVPVISYSPAALSYVEGSTATFQLEADIALAATATFDLTRAGGGISPHFGFGPTMLTIGAGETLSQEITLSPKQDEVVELLATETLTATLISSGTELDVTGLNQGLAVAVIDDDSPNVMVVATGERTSFDEGVGTIELSVSLTSSPNQEVLVDLSNPGGGTLGSDEYTFPSMTRFTFAAGATALSQTVILRVSDDDIEEANETLRIAYSLASEPDSATVVGSPLVLTITDDDAPVVTVTRGKGILREGEQTILMFRVDKTPINDLTVNIPGTNNDVGLSRNSVILRAGQLEQTVTLAAVNDNFDEPDETVTLSFELERGGSRAILAPSSASLSITVIDTNVPVVSASAAAADEAGVVTLALEVNRNPVSPLVVAVILGTRGSATAGEDYDAGSISSNAVTLTAAGAAGRQTVTVDLTDDDEIEATETIEFILSLMSGDAILETNTQFADILDNDVLTLTVSVTETELTEGGETSIVTLTAAEALPSDLTVLVGFGGGTADAADVAFAREVNFAMSETEASFMVRALPDLMTEPDGEVLIVSLGANLFGRGVVFAGAELTFTIIDVPPPPALMLPAFTSADLMITQEADDDRLFRATLVYNVSIGQPYPTSVGWRTVSGSEFFALGTPEVQFMPDDGTYEFSVEITFDTDGDGVVEAFVRQAGAPREDWSATAPVAWQSAPVSGVPSTPPPSNPSPPPSSPSRPTSSNDDERNDDQRNDDEPPPPTSGVLCARGLGAVCNRADVILEIPRGATDDVLRGDFTELSDSYLDRLPPLPPDIELLASVPLLDIDLIDSNDNEIRRLSRMTRLCLRLNLEDYNDISDPAALRVLAYHDGEAEWDVLRAAYEIDREYLCTFTQRFSVFTIGLVSPEMILDEVELPSAGDGGVVRAWVSVAVLLAGVGLVLGGVGLAVRGLRRRITSAV